MGKTGGAPFIRCVPSLPFSREKFTARAGTKPFPAKQTWIPTWDGSMNPWGLWNLDRAGIFSFQLRFRALPSRNPHPGSFRVPPLPFPDDPTGKAEGEQRSWTSPGVSFSLERAHIPLFFPLSKIIQKQGNRTFGKNLPLEPKETWDPSNFRGFF